MDILEYTEQQVGATLEVLRATYDDLHERLQKFITALVAGAGAVAGFALTKYASHDGWLARYTLLSLAAAWFIIAASAMLRGGTTRTLSPGNGPMNITSFHDGWLAKLTSEGAADAEDQALRRTRMEELRLQQTRIETYRDASVERAKTIDVSYKLVALSWIVPLLVYGVGTHAH